MNKEFGVIPADLTGRDLHIKKLLLKHKLVRRLIPAPRHLSSDCGVGVRVLE